ncbi:MAG: Smr/MutS family protein [Candidatus Gracilibacteria bacterium]|jgi:DNA-nicking Smr family endonuclease|nr:Smr/MutS family protein [Candidatus Gracilibacteria bacterium]
MKEKFRKINKYEHLSKPEKELDFHNRGLLNEEQINTITKNFLGECINSKIKKTLIITGKGLHSKNGIARVKPIVQNILRSNSQIKTFSDGRIDRGDTGAIEITFY